jgi:DNA polymerase III delta subunit
MATPKTTQIFAISGSEDLLRRREVQRTVEEQSKKGWRVEYVDGAKQGSLEDAVGDVFFDTGQPLLVVVRSPEKVKIEVYEELRKNGRDHIVLLLDHEGDPKGNTKVGKFITGLGKAHKSYEKPTPWKAAEGAVAFCIHEAKAKGKVIDPQLAEGMVQMLGTDLGALAFEIEKIVTLADVEGVTDVSADIVKAAYAPLSETPFTAVSDALGVRDRRGLSRAMNRVKRTTKGDPTLGVVRRSLGPAVQQWISVSSLLAQGNSVEDVAITLGRKPFFVQNVVKVTRRWQMSELLHIVKILADAERAVLSGMIHPWVRFSADLISIC